MKKLVYICIAVVSLQEFSLKAMESKFSRCETTAMLCEAWVLKNVCGMTNQDIIVQAAQNQNPRKLELCIALKIGKLHKKDSEGHTPRSAAELCGNTETLAVILGSPTSVTHKKLE